MNTTNRLNLVYTIALGFAIAVLFTGLKNYDTSLTAFDLGQNVGSTFKALVKTVLILSVLTYFVKTYKIQNIACLFFILFLISIFSSLAYSTTYNSSYDFGYSVGGLLRQHLNGVFTIFLILFIFKPSAVRPRSDEY